MNGVPCTVGAISSSAVVLHIAPGTCQMVQLSPSLSFTAYHVPSVSAGVAPTTAGDPTTSYEAIFSYGSIVCSFGTCSNQSVAGYGLNVQYTWTCSTAYGQVDNASIENVWADTGQSYYWQTWPSASIVAPTGRYPTVDSSGVLDASSNPAVLDQNLDASTGTVHYYATNKGTYGTSQGSIALGC